ncbi:MAG: hypothetical protein AAF919_03420 [Pseudomonadota bacterium]
MSTALASNRPLPFDEFIAEIGPAEYETNWRPLRLAMRIAAGVTAIGAFLFLLGLLTGDPVWSLLLLTPIAAGLTVILQKSAAVRGVRVDERGIACLPEGPRITAREIVAVQLLERRNPGQDSFDAHIAEPRVVPMIAPLMFMGRRVGVSLAKRITPRPRR